MAAVTNEFISEVLKSMRTLSSNLEDGRREIKSELQAVRGCFVAMQQDISNLYAGQVKIELRRERIELRRDLVDVAV